MNRLRRIGTFLADRVNPIAVKELRQAVQSRLVISILLLFLAVNVAIVSGFLMLHENVAKATRRRGRVFMILFGVLVTTCMFFVPLYAGIRMTLERNDANIDLLFITTISPAAIIRGKFWSAVALTVLIFSTVMPFLTFTYLLRGIDLPSVFFALAMALTFVSFMTMLAIFAGSISAGWLVRILMGLFLLGMLFWALMGTIGFGYEIVSRGVVSQFFGREAWTEFVLNSLMVLCLLGLMYLLSVACISAKSSNRMLPIRLFLTGVWLVFGVVLGIWSSVDTNYEPLVIWAVVSVCAFSAFLLFIPAERESWTPRVRRRIPRYALPRFLAWLLYTGSAGGDCVCGAAIVGATLLVAWLGLELPLNSSGRRNWGSLNDTLTWLPAIFLFSWCYSLTGLLVRRMVAPKSPTVVTPIISISLLTLARLCRCRSSSRTFRLIG